MGKEEKTYLKDQTSISETKAELLPGKFALEAKLLDALTGGKKIKNILRWPTRNVRWPGFMEFNNFKASILLYTDKSAELRVSFNRRPLKMPSWRPRVQIEFVLLDRDKAGIEIVNLEGLGNSCANVFEIRSEYLARPHEFYRIQYGGPRLSGGEWGRCP